MGGVASYHITPGQCPTQDTHLEGLQAEELSSAQKAVQEDIIGESIPAFQLQGREVGLGSPPFFLLTSDFRSAECPVGG